MQGLGGRRRLWGAHPGGQGINRTMKGEQRETQGNEEKGNLCPIDANTIQ